MKLKPAEQAEPKFTLTKLAELAQAYNASGHSVFGPSSSKTWLTCAGSLIPNLLAKDPGNVDAAYGTVAHGVSELWLKTGIKPRHLIGTNEFVQAGDWDEGGWGWLIVIDEEMMHYVQQSVDRCILEPGDHIVEQKVWFSRLTPIPNQGGTLDFAALRPGLAIVTDHKYGKSEPIYAERNTQAMLYALGLFYEWDWFYNFQRFVLRIHQPRLDHFDEWECSRDELMEFAGYVKERAAAAWKLNAPRTPHPDACRWCKVRSTCAANAQMQYRLTAQASAEAFGEVPAEEVVMWQRSLTDDIDPFKPEMIDPLTLTTEQLAALKPYRKMFEGWWKAADYELLKRALAGANVPGFKAVEARTKRRLKNPDESVEHFSKFGLSRSDIFVESTASPSDIERKLIKLGFARAELPNMLEGWIHKPPGKPTLAPINDRRPELVDPSAIAFADNPETTEDEDY